MGYSNHCNGHEIILFVKFLKDPSSIDPVVCAQLRFEGVRQGLRTYMRRRKQRNAGTPKPMLLCRSSALLGETIPREKIAETGEEAVAYATQVRPEKNRTISQLFKHMIATNPLICLSKRSEQSDTMLGEEKVCGSWVLNQSRLVLG
jgi:hypothetical protein